MLHEITPHKLNIAYENLEPQDSNLVIVVRDGKVMKRDDNELVLPSVGELGLKKDEVRFLFRIDEMAFFMPLKFEMTESELAADGFNFEIPRNLRHAQPMWLSYAVVLGFRLQEFYRSNAFCGKCGAKTVHDEDERAIVCPECGNKIFPPIAPSVIVLIRNGNETVLTKYQPNHSPYRRYALVAGYVESGETPEEAVSREVFEEVGLRVKNITYYKSQPWPLTGALLLGFVCDLDGDNTIVRQEEELAVAEWVKREHVPERTNDVSLTSEMMEMFRTGRL